jgi:hypothetical protein
VGLHHYQYSGYAFVQSNPYSKHGLNAYHDSYDGSYGYRYNKLGLTCGGYGFMVSQSDNDLRDTYGSWYLQLYNSLNWRLWYCECDGYYNGVCLSLS